MQPTFLYELIWNVLVFVVLIYVDRRFTLGHGRLFALYVAGYCVGRFWVELLRDDTATHIAGIRINSFTSTFVFIGAVVYFILAPKGREDPASLRGNDGEVEVSPITEQAAAAAAVGRRRRSATNRRSRRGDGRVQRPMTARSLRRRTAEASRYRGIRAGVGGGGHGAGRRRVRARRSAGGPRRSPGGLAEAGGSGTNRASEAAEPKAVEPETEQLSEDSEPLPDEPEAAEPAEAEPPSSSPRSRRRSRWNRTPRRRSRSTPTRKPWNPEAEPETAEPESTAEARGDRAGDDRADGDAPAPEPTPREDRPGAEADTAGPGAVRGTSQRRPTRRRPSSRRRHRGRATPPEEARKRRICHAGTVTEPSWGDPADPGAPPQHRDIKRGIRRRIRNTRCRDVLRPGRPFGRHPVTGQPLSDKSKTVAGLCSCSA